GAVAEALGIHLGDHLAGATGALRLTLRQQSQVRDLGGDKEHRRGVWTGGDAGPTADAGRRVHRLLLRRLRDRDGVAVGRPAGVDRHEAARLNDAVESTAIDDEVLDQRKGSRSPRLDVDLVAVLESAHVDLAGGGAALGTVRPAIDDQGAGAANALAA